MMHYKINPTITILISVVLCFLSLPSLSIAAENEFDSAVYLNRYATVTGKMITLGDLFSGVKNPKKLIAKAPYPGKERIFTSRQLFKIARQNKLDWFPTSREDTVTVTVPTKPFPKDLLKNILKTAISEKIEGDFVSIDIVFQSPQRRFLLPQHTEPHIIINHLNYNEKIGSFSASVDIGSDDGRFQTTVSVQGKAVVNIAIPVLNHTLARGDTIRKSDFTVKAVPSFWKRRNIIIDPQKADGQIARKKIISGVPVTLDQIEKPIMVKKKSLVTIRFITPGLIITSRGIALENGKMDDVIRIQNTNSKKIIEATVTGIQMTQIVYVPILLRSDNQALRTTN